MLNFEFRVAASFTGFQLSTVPIILGKYAVDYAGSEVFGGGYFEGSISHLAIYSAALDMFAVDCMYQTLESSASVCSANPAVRSVPCHMT